MKKRIEISIERLMIETTTYIVEIEEELKHIDTTIDNRLDIRHKNIDIAMNIASDLKGVIEYSEYKPKSYTIDCMYEIKKDE